jgi:hypothetical protein
LVEVLVIAVASLVFFGGSKGAVFWNEDVFWVVMGSDVWFFRAYNYQSLVVGLKVRKNLHKCVVVKGTSHVHESL